MKNQSSTATHRHHLHRSSIAGLMLAAVFASAAVCARPASLNLSLNRPTERGVFVIKIASATSPIPMSRVHRWSLHVTGVDGRAVQGATIKVDGGMPEHGHGLPTSPRAEAAGVPGGYFIKGMKFSMTGWWVLKLNVMAPDGRHDQVTFNVML